MWLSDELGTSLVAEALFSTDPAALCARYGVSTKTLERWKARCSSDQKLAAVVSKKKNAQREEWEDEAVRFMRRGLRKLDELVDKAAVTDMRNVSGAIHLVGNLLVASGVLRGKPLPNHPPDPEPSEAEGDAGDGEHPALN